MIDFTTKLLSVRFRAYLAAGPKLVLVEPAPAVQRYEHDGFLTNTETRQERIDRINAATNAGFALGPLDTDFIRRRCPVGGSIKYAALRDMRKADRATTYHENLILSLRDSERTADHCLGRVMNSRFLARQNAKL